MIETRTRLWKRAGLDADKEAGINGKLKTRRGMASLSAAWIRNGSGGVFILGGLSLELCNA